MAVDTKTLIATIVSEVLHRLEQPAGPVALVLAPACEELKCEVQNRLGGNAQVYFQGNEPSAQPDIYVLPELSCSDLADLAVDELMDVEGMTEERAASLIMAARAPLFAGENQA